MTPGRFTGTIEENDIRSAGSGTEYIFLRVNVETESIPVQIWLTEKAMGMARAQLRVCGFDVDKDPLQSIRDNNGLLQGRDVPIEIYEEEYKGRLQLKARIPTSDVSKKRIASLEKMLRSGADPGPASEEVDDIPF